MQDPAGLYRLETDIDLADAKAPVLIVALAGFFDAGAAQSLVVRHLMERLDHRVVATFDVDQVLDYRGRRPAMTFNADHWGDYDDPTLALYRFIDDVGTPFLLLSGPEPDYQWERCVEAVRQLIVLLGVEVVVTAHGIPMAVPHTRPLGVSFHATDPKRRADHTPLFGTVTVPGSLASLLELRLGESGVDACGVAVYVPHYLAQSDFPPAAVTALDHLAEQTGLKIPDSALRLAAAETMKVVATELEGSPDAAELVKSLERQYDTRTEEPSPGEVLLDPDGKVPTADQLGAEFEAFLRDEAGS
ncbi:MAG: PAC2 family protein [Micrococcales bacterium]|nr:PAC2 family protein [Micrococcales bacterium]